MSRLRLSHPNRAATPRRIGVILVAVVIAGCSTDGAKRSAPPSGTEPNATVNPASTPYPYTACDALSAGDAMTSPSPLCAPDSSTQVQTADCIQGIYVHLARPDGADLEGIVGRTPTWLKAAPLDPALGRTTWAFENCQERG